MREWRDIMTVFELQALAAGLVVGSFANVCIHRLPRGESVVTPRSRCPQCAAPIGALDNVPVLSYLVLRGRCRRCRTRISPRYPAVEAANGLLYLALAVSLGPVPRAFVLMAFTTAVLVLGLIDLEHQLLHDVITLPGIAAGFVASFLPGSPVTPLGSCLAAAGGLAALTAINLAYRAARGSDGFGGGDPKMVAMIGAFLGWKATLLAVFIASLAGTFVGLGLVAFRGRTARHKLPFGTFLALGALVVTFAGDPLLAWYKGLFRG
jgi:leader peptidase (prepilin peptidase)/N-methyltransferase